MNKKIKFFIISYFMFLCLGTISCEDCGPFPDSFKVTNLNWSTYEGVFIEMPNNELNLSEITQNSVLFNRFSILIEPQKETYFSAINRINLMNSAYACDPKPPITIDNIENIEIFANKDFNSNHLIGENLASIFDIIIFDPENEIYNEKFDLESYLSTKPKVPAIMVLMLKDSPLEISDFKFTIKYYQNGKDVNYLEFETNSIEIKK